MVSRGLLRVSDNIEKSDTRIFFVPRGVPVRINMNRVRALLLRGLAAEIDRRAARCRRDLGVKRGANRRGK